MITELSATTSPEVIAALIALVGVVVSVGITLLIGLLTRRYNYHHLFAETVSQNRMDWINVWRENISEFLACAKVLRKYSNKEYVYSQERLRKVREEYMFRMERARRMITTRLNLTEEMHVMMLGAINSFSYKESSNIKFNAKCVFIEELARKILKLEWERVKEEAKGKRR